MPAVLLMLAFYNLQSSPIMVLTITILNVDNSFTESVDADTFWLYWDYSEADVELLCWFSNTVLCDIYSETAGTVKSIVAHHS